MKHIYTSLIVATLTACSTEIQNLEPAAAMRRDEVIMATQQCEDADMRPRVVYGYRVVQDRRVAVPIDVQCEPSAWRKGK
jgi:hypothetical protein